MASLLNKIQAWPWNSTEFYLVLPALLHGIPYVLHSFHSCNVLTRPGTPGRWYQLLLHVKNREPWENSLQLPTTIFAHDPAVFLTFCLLPLWKRNPSFWGLSHHQSPAMLYHGGVMLHELVLLSIANLLLLHIFHQLSKVPKSFSSLKPENPGCPSSLFLFCSRDHRGLCRFKAKENRIWTQDTVAMHSAFHEDGMLHSAVIDLT